jgi:hypothetical protein
VGGVEALGESPRGAAFGADLGGSSKYTNENFVDRSGEGFHVNSSWTWVSRPLEIGERRSQRVARDAAGAASRSAPLR